MNVGWSSGKNETTGWRAGGQPQTSISSAQGTRLGGALLQVAGGPPHPSPFPVFTVAVYGFTVAVFSFYCLQ